MLSGTGAGTLSGLGTEFKNFASLAIDAGADWKLTGRNTLAAGTVLTDSGTLAVSQSFIDGGQANLEAGGVLNAVGSGEVLLGQLTMTGGILRDDPQATLAIGATLTGAEVGAITVESGAALSGFGTLAGAAVTDNGAITATAGTLALTGSVSGGGTVLLQSGATLSAQGALGGVAVVFDGNATLALGAPTSVTSTLSGFGSGDVVDLEHLKADSLSYGGGILTLMEGTAVVDRISLAGHYNTANFALSADGHGGTDINFVASEAAGHGFRSAAFSWLMERETAQPIGSRAEYIGGWHTGEAGSPAGADLFIVQHGF